MQKDAWLVVGLGNPGPKYAATRHNIGQMVLDQIAEDASESFKTHKTNNLLASVQRSVPGPQLVLIKPMSFMNLSGGPVSSAAKFFSIEPEKIIVVHDELDIDFGQIKLKKGGGHGGHNGLRDIAKALGTPDFLRVRVGIGRPPGRQDPADFVLSNFSSENKKELPFLIQDAAEAISLITERGLLDAQQIVHSRAGA